MRTVLKIDVKIDSVNGLEHGEKSVSMIQFHGDAKSEYFNGTILSGGVDTQIKEGSSFTLSARYLMSGTDSCGKQCKIFIENNGRPDTTREGRFITKPKIITDSDALKFLEEEALNGEVLASEEGVKIFVYCQGDLVV